MTPAVPAQAAASPGQEAETARRLLQHAVHLEEAVGDPEAAIAAYEEVIAAPEADAPVTAVAEFRLAVLLDRVGRREASRGLHRRITERYADDPRLAELVALARAALGERASGTTNSSMVARRLWAGSEAYAYGSLAPDGSYLSFVDWTSGNVAVHDLDRESKRYLTFMDPAESPESWACSTAVAPDGERIAYTLVREQAGHEIRLVYADGSGDRLLMEPEGLPRHVELEGWSRDGKSLVAQVFGKDASADLVLISVEDGSVKSIRDLGNPAPDAVSLSPDGRWVVYHREGPDGDRDLYISSAEGGEARPLLRHPSNDLFPLWAPDGRHLIFVSDRTGGLAAWALPMRDGESEGDARLVKSDFGRSLPMGFTEHGALIYAVQASMNDVYTAELDLDTGKLLERSAASGRYVGVNRSPAWADGERLVYLSDRGPLPAGMAPTSLVVRDRRTGEETSLATELRRPMVPRWQERDDSVWVEARHPDEGWGIYRIPLDRGAAERMVGWEEDACACGGSPAVSSERVAYLLPTGDKSAALMLRTLADGGERTLVKGLVAADLRALRFSPDGARLAAALRRRDGSGPAVWRLEVAEANGGPLAAVADLGADGEAIEIVGWLDGGRLLATLRTEGARRLAVIDVDARSLRPLSEPLPEDVREMSLHPDGERLVFAAGAYRAEIWMLENPLAPVLDAERGTAR